MRPAKWIEISWSNEGVFLVERERPKVRAIQWVCRTEKTGTVGYGEWCYSWEWETGCGGRKSDCRGNRSQMARETRTTSCWQCVVWIGGAKAKDMATSYTFLIVIQAKEERRHHWFGWRKVGRLKSLSSFSFLVWSLSCPYVCLYGKILDLFV